MPSVDATLTTIDETLRDCSTPTQPTWRHLAQLVDEVTERQRHANEYAAEMLLRGWEVWVAQIARTLDVLNEQAKAYLDEQAASKPVANLELSPPRRYRGTRRG